MNRKMSHVVYNPRIEFPVFPDGCSYIELWRGLPRDIEFQSAESGDGKPALRYEKEGNYVWINPNALEAITTDPGVLLVAHGREKRSKLHIISVEPASKLDLFKGSLDEAMVSARRLTNQWFNESAKKSD